MSEISEETQAFLILVGDEFILTNNLAMELLNLGKVDFELQEKLAPVEML